jgi:hypothetical protein
MEIKKETFVDADEGTTKALTFDLLSGLHEKLDELTRIYRSHLDPCDKRFKKLENQKRLNTVAAGGGGVIGGVLASLYQWFIK